MIESPNLFRRFIQMLAVTRSGNRSLLKSQDTRVVYCYERNSDVLHEKKEDFCVFVFAFASNSN